MNVENNRTRRPAWVEVDLGAIRRNVAAVRKWVGPECGVWAVVKGNAYGHGLVPAGLAALKGGAAGLAVAIPDEAIALRDGGVAARILVMGISEPAAADDIVRNGLDAAVSTVELLAALSDAGLRYGTPARVHVKVDTGMGRVGVLPESANDFLRRVAQAPGVRWTGLMTHFATADDDPEYALEQWRRFSAVIEAALSMRGAPDPLCVHAANSAATCRLPQSYQATAGAAPMVRPGLLIYGISPMDGGFGPSVEPALSLKARVTQARNVPAGTCVSYGATVTTVRPTRLAIVPVGYADGYSRANSNRASVLLRGKRVPILGRVCMDQFVIDATESGAEIGDEVVLIGRQGDEAVTVLDEADWAESIHHEVLTRLSDRLPRVYEG
ncbi:MAG TPA: alanine racemase [Armatimonadota bacterium]|jgi:alanine racemase